MKFACLAVIAISFSSPTFAKDKDVMVKNIENVAQIGAADVLIQECRESLKRFAAKKNTLAVFCADGVFVCKRAIVTANAIKESDPAVIKFFKDDVYANIKKEATALKEIVSMCN